MVCILRQNNGSDIIRFIILNYMYFSLGLGLSLVCETGLIWVLRFRLPFIFISTFTILFSSGIIDFGQIFLVAHKQFLEKQQTKT